MYIHKAAKYLPATVVPNAYFEQINGLTDAWITARTGIKERRKASPPENTNTLGLAAVEALRAQVGDLLQDVDLIIGATYTPKDTVATLAHHIQHQLGIADIPAVCISAACSSFLNAAEIVQGYFALGKATLALVVTAEHNTAFSQEQDLKSGHLWGDGAAAVLFSKEPISDSDFKVLDIQTAGAATVGKALEGVQLDIAGEGLLLPNGRDVFIQACQYMANATERILYKNGFSTADLTHFIPHQANYRITRNVLQRLRIDESVGVSNIQYLGNTGCAGAAIALAEKQDSIASDALIALSVFGGGYSYGAMLLKRL